MPYGYVSKEESELINAITKWTTGRFEEINGKMKTILRDDTPQEIVKKRDRLWELILLNMDDEGQ